MPAPAPLRLPRASVFAGVCVGVSAGGHALSSGHGVAPAGVVAGFALVLAAAHGLAQRERGLGAVTALMLWCQLALHVLFSVTGTGTAVTGSHAVGHQAAGSVGGLGGADLGPGMLLAHAAAGLACACWLRQGERSAFDLLGLLHGLFRRLFALPAPTPPRPRPVVLPRAPVPSVFGGVLFLRHVRVLRGPPAPFQS